MKKILSIFMSLCMLLSITAGLSLTANAEEKQTKGYYSYTVTDGVATITDCDESISGDIAIPSTLSGYPVTGIGAWAFEKCTSLTSITIPNRVTNIGVLAFNGCTSLTRIDVNSANKNYCSEDGVLFNKDKTELVQYPAGKSETNYIIPDSVTSIGEEAFGCSSLTSVTIPDSVTSIGEGAFENCKSLTSITISNNVTSIAGWTFEECTSLTSITIPNSVTNNTADVGN